MTQLWRRYWQIQIGQVLIQQRESSLGIVGGDASELTVRFDIKKTLGREPNECTVQIANLSNSTFRSLEQAEDPQIEINAGYIDNNDVIYVGDARDIWTVKEGVDRWTTIESEDGGRAYRRTTLDRGYEPGTPVSTVLRDCARAMGVGIGNINQVISAGVNLQNNGEDAEDRFENGTVVSGPAYRSLSRVCRSCGLRYSIQNGILQFRRAGQPANTTAILLTPSSGLIGSPTRNKRDERTGRVTIGAKSLLVPGLYPGRVVQIETNEINGAFLVSTARYIGDTTGNDWFVDMELREY